MKLPEGYGEFKAAELRRWYDGECAGRVGEAVMAERARIRAAVQELPGWPVFNEHDGSPVSYGNLVDRPLVLAIVDDTP